MSMPSKLITTLTFAAVLLLAGCGDKSPESRIQAARKALRAADYTTAAIELKGALQSAPSNAEARLLLAQAFQALEQWSASEEALRKALASGASPEQVLPSLMHTLVQLGEYQQAINLEIPKGGLGSQALASVQAERATALIGLNKPAEASAAISEGEQVLSRSGLSDFSPDLQLAKALLAVVNKQPSQAMSILDASLRHDPKQIQALLFKARLLKADGKNADAKKIYQQILEINPKHFLAHLSLVDLYQQAGDIDAADKTLLAIEKLAPGNPLVQYARATIDIRRGNIKKAKDTIQNVIKVLPNHLPSRLLEGTINYMLGNYEISSKSAEVVLSQLPMNLQAARLLAASMLKMNNPQGSLNTLLPLLGTYNNDAEILAMVGESYLKIRDYANAMIYLDRAVNLEPKNPSFKSQQAAGHLALGETASAVSGMEKAVSLSNKPGQADMALIMLYLGSHDFDQALKSIDIFEKKLPNNPITHNLRAAAYLGKKDLVSAHKSLEKALAIDPGFFPAATNLAHLDMQDGKPKAARKWLEGLLAVNKNNVPAMLAMAELAAAGKQDKEQFDWLEKAIKVDPKNIQARRQIVTYHLSKGKNAEALAQAREAVNQSQMSPEALDLLGSTQLATNDKKAAIETYVRLTAKSNDSPAVYYHLALAQLAAEDVHAAITSLQQALNIDANFTPALDALMQIQMKSAKPESALTIARKAQIERPKSPFGFEREGDINLAQKKFTLAIKPYKRAIELGGGASSLIKLHRALVSSGESKPAEQYLNDWIKQHPSDMVVRGYAAEYYLSLGRNREAIVQYEALIKSMPGNTGALNNLATLYQREKDGRAQAMAEQALKLRPGDPNIMDTLGWILVEKGDLSRAAELLGSAVSQVPKAGGIRYHYAVALARAGKKSEARKELAEAIASGVQFPELENAKIMLKGL